MKLSLSRRSVLITLLAVIVLAALPGWIRRFVETGDLYLFTNRFFQDLVARFFGPGRLRFILQPIVAISLGIRDGITDARTGRRPFLAALLYDQGNRMNLVQSAMGSTLDVIAIAVILDLISQFLIFREVHPGAAFLLGPILIAVPYSVARALANRTSVWRR